jgi:ribose/xylose/arabinose/galactoside ABC-type transport system permease subunit
LLGINPFLVTLGMLIILRGLCAYIIPEGLYYLPEGFIALGNAAYLISLLRSSFSLSL